MAPREVYLDAFAIDRDEVSVAEYRACVAAGACKLDPLIAGDERYIRDELADGQRRPGTRRRTSAAGAAAGCRPRPSGSARRAATIRRGDLAVGRARAAQGLQPRSAARARDARDRAHASDRCRCSSSAIPTTATATRCSRRPAATRGARARTARATRPATSPSGPPTRGSRRRQGKGYDGPRSTINPLRDGPHTRRRAWCAAARGASRSFIAKSNLRDPFNRTTTRSGGSRTSAFAARARRAAAGHVPRRRPRARRSASGGAVGRRVDRVDRSAVDRSSSSIAHRVRVHALCVAMLQHEAVRRSRR